MKNKIILYFRGKKELNAINKIIKASWNYSDTYNLKKDDAIKQITELLKTTGAKYER